MITKYFLSLLLLFTLIHVHVDAQPKREKIESIKIAYLAERLNLDPKTAERFWPVYNQYENEIHQIIEEGRRGNADRSVDEILDQEQKAIDAKRKYSSQFLKIIDDDQLSTLYRSEREFNKMLLRRMNRNENRREQMHSPGIRRSEPFKQQRKPMEEKSFERQNERPARPAGARPEDQSTKPSRFSR